MKKEILLYGTKKGEPSYMETLLAENILNSKMLADEMNKAKKEGFIKFRTAIFEMSKPDFVGAINLK